MPSLNQAIKIYNDGRSSAYRVSAGGPIPRINLWCRVDIESVVKKIDEINTRYIRADNPFKALMVQSRRKRQIIRYNIYYEDRPIPRITSAKLQGFHTDLVLDDEVEILRVRDELFFFLRSIKQ